MSKTKRVKLADVLWRAANEHLLPDAHDTGNHRGQWYSCNAIECVLFPENEGITLWLPPEVTEFLTSLGCDCGSSLCFSEFRDWEQRQGVRYMWLLLAMHVAADEDIEVEVQA